MSDRDEAAYINESCVSTWFLFLFLAVTDMNVFVVLVNQFIWSESPLKNWNFHRFTLPPWSVCVFIYIYAVLNATNFVSLNIDFRRKIRFFMIFCTISHHKERVIVWPSTQYAKLQPNNSHQLVAHSGKSSEKNEQMQVLSSFETVTY